MDARAFFVSTIFVAFLQPDSESRVGVGETITGTLTAEHPTLPGHGPSARFELVCDVDGRVTISLDSFDFDAFVRVENESGELLVENDNGGVETNARASVATKAAAHFRVIVAAVAAAPSKGGEFRLSVSASDVPRPAGAALADAGADYHAKAAERALARGDEQAAADHRLEEGNRLCARSAYTRAKAAFQAALELDRKIGDRRGEAMALGNLGVVLQDLGDFAGARESLVVCSEIFRSLGEPKHQAGVLGNLGGLCHAVGDYAMARDYDETQLEIARSLGDRAQVAMALGNLGNVWQSLGDYAKAREYQEQCRELSREIGDRSSEALAIGALGSISLEVGEYEQAKELFERWLELTRALGDRSGEAEALGRLGSVHKVVGDFAKARDCFEKRLEISRALGLRSAEATSLASLGELYENLGEYAKALESCNVSLALLRSQGDRVAEGLLLIILGNVHHSLGDYSKAMEHHKSSLAIARMLGRRFNEAVALGGLGLAHWSLGDFPKARKCTESQLAIARSLGDRSVESVALANLGAIFRFEGDFARACDCIEQQLAISRARGEPMREAAGLGNLGALYQAMGDSAKAREMASAAMDVWTRLGTEESLLAPLHTLCQVAVSERDSTTAVDMLRRANAILDRPATRSLTPDDAAGRRSRFAGFERFAQDLTALRLEEAASDSAARSRALGDGFREAGRWKGRALLEGIVEHDAGGRSADVIRRRRTVAEILAKRSAVLIRISEKINQGKSSDDVDGERECADALLARAEKRRDEIFAISPKDAALARPVGAEPEAARRALVSENSALVEYVQGEKRLFAYVLTPVAFEFVELGRLERIDECVGRYGGLLSGQPELGAPVAIAERGHELFETLLAPVLRVAGEKIERLVVVPTGSLATLPLEALVIRTLGESAPRSFGDLEFVLDRFEVCYGPSTPVLVEMASRGPRQGSERVLVLADPLYPGEAREAREGRAPAPLVGFAWASRRARPATGEWPRLDKTRDEALGLARLLLGSSPAPESAASLVRLGETRSRSESFAGADVHVGSEASRRALAGNLQRYSVIHVATHGYVDAEMPRESALVLAGEGNEVYFTIGDVLDLDLDANLVVLSACKTARGKPLAGEGVQSMARAFVYAGARSVIASLWDVSDLAGAETMKAFYEQALRGVTVGQSLRRAKLGLRYRRGSRGVGGIAGRSDDAELAHPFFWAPFVHVGPHP